MMLSVSTVGIVSSSKDSSSELDILENKLKAAISQRQAAEAAVEKAEGERHDAIARKKAIDDKIYALDCEIEAITALAKGYNKKIDERNEQIDAEKERLDNQYQVLRTRIRAKREDGNIDFLSVLFDTDGLSELFTQIDRFICMLDYDSKLLNSYKDGITRLETLKEELVNAKNDLDVQMSDLNKRKAQLAVDLASAKRLISSLENRIDDAESEIERIDKIEAEYNQKREELLAELEKTSNNSFVDEQFIWPLPSKYTKISSPYGWRIHPVTKKQQFHRGIDIPAPYGTEIMAVASGTVIECSSNYADGNYITISHGGGIASFYSHLSRFRVKVGDKVTQGQIIGNVGTSGYTTGAHLNLNMYKDNKSVNPVDFFK